jgi:hypothetical protein
MVPGAELEVEKIQMREGRWVIVDLRVRAVLDKAARTSKVVTLDKHEVSCDLCARQHVSKFARPH